MQPQRGELKSSSDATDLPPGFRFEPTDFELIDYYLRRRASRIGSETYSFIHEQDVYAHAPWDIVPAATADHNDGSESMQQYYFFTCRRRSGNGSKRVNRNAGCGFWDCHGHDIVIRDPADPNKVIGHKIQLNFKVVDEFNRKKTTKTSWIMHEYWMESDEFQELVLCRIYDKKRSSYNEEAEMVIRQRTDQVVVYDDHHHEEVGGGSSDQYWSSSQGSASFIEGQLLLQEEAAADKRGVKRPHTENPSPTTFQAAADDQECGGDERGSVKRQRVQVFDPEPAAGDHDQQIVLFVDQHEPTLVPTDQVVDAQQFVDAGDTAAVVEPSSSQTEYYDHHEEEAGGGSSDQDDWLSSPGMLAFLEEYPPPDLDDYIDILAEGQLLLQEEEEEAAKRGVKRQQTGNPWPTTSCQAADDDQERGGSVKRQRVQVANTEPADQNCFDQINVPLVDQHEPATLFPTDHEDVVDAQQFADAGGTAAEAEPSSSRANDEEYYRDHQAAYPIQSQDMVLLEGTELRGDKSQRIIDNPEPSSSLVVADDQEFFDQLLAIKDQGPAPLTWDDSTSYGPPLIPWPEDNFFTNTFAISNYLGGFW